jgi:adenosine deaminase
LRRLSDRPVSEERRGVLRQPERAPMRTLAFAALLWSSSAPVFSQGRPEWTSTLPPVRMDTGQPRIPGSIYVDEATFGQMLLELPKTEIHTHVEGAVRASTVLDVADEYGYERPAASVPELQALIGMRPGETLTAFLKKFDPFRFVFDHPETLERVAYEMLEDNAAENVCYTEIRINPVKRPDKVAVGQVLDSILEGMRRGERDFGVEARLIASINRSYPVAQAWEVAREAVARKDDGIVGLDLAGDEARHAPAKFAGVFQYAKANGLQVTVHAGEALGPESIQGAVRDTLADRIGHGVRLQEDPELERQFAASAIPLEMSPTSNLLINVVKDLKTYPLRRYYHAGIPVTINTDDRHIFGSTLTGEYHVLAKETGLSLQELEQISWNGLRHAFLSAPEKMRLSREFRERMTRFEADWRAQLPR